MSFNTQLFHAHLQARLARDGISLRDAAKRSGISASTLSRIIHGKAPDMETFATLAAWLGTDACVFFDHNVYVIEDEAPAWAALHMSLDALGMPREFIEALDKMVRAIRAKKEGAQQGV